MREAQADAIVQMLQIISNQLEEIKAEVSLTDRQREGRWYENNKDRVDAMIRKAMGEDGT